MGNNFKTLGNIFQGTSSDASNRPGTSRPPSSHFISFGGHSGNNSASPINTSLLKRSRSSRENLNQLQKLQPVEPKITKVLPPKKYEALLLCTPQDSQNGALIATKNDILPSNQYPHAVCSYQQRNKSFMDFIPQLFKNNIEQTQAPVTIYGRITSFDEKPQISNSLTSVRALFFGGMNPRPCK